MSTVRDRGFADFHAIEPELRNGGRHWLMRAHNFIVEWIELPGDAAGFEFDSDFESFVILTDGTATVAAVAASPVAIPAGAIAIVPAGRQRLDAPRGARLALVASQRGDVAGRRALNREGIEPPDPRVAPAGRPYRRRVPLERAQVLALDAVRAASDKPRLKMLQTETLSLNLVAYDGPRDRRELSPHRHASFEQGSLALGGDFVHHLRVPWGADAGAWRPDEHLAAPSPSLLVVPVEMIHTSEGVGAGHHFLVDVFSPPRDDFIARGWVFNADDYEAAAP